MQNGKSEPAGDVVFRFANNVKGSQRLISKFHLSLWQMLADSSFKNEICWSDDGTYFIIKKPKAFAERVLPMYFKHSNINSFIRQLQNCKALISFTSSLRVLLLLDEFTKVYLLPNNQTALTAWKRQTPYSGLLAFQHPNFCRDHPEYLPQVRKKVSTEAGNFWQAVAQINMKLDKVLDRVSNLEDRMKNAETSNLMTKSQCQQLGSVVHCMFSALISSRDGLGLKQTDFRPRYLVRRDGKLGEENISPVTNKKRRTCDSVVNDLSDQGFLSISSENLPSGALLKRSQLLPYNIPERDARSIIAPVQSVEEPNLHDYSLKPQCSALVVRNQAVPDPVLNSGEEGSLQFNESGFDELSQLLAAYGAGDEMADSSTCKSNDQLPQSSASTMALADPHFKWMPNLTSPHMLDFNENEDSYLGAYDITGLYSPLDSQGEIEANKAICAPADHEEDILNDHGTSAAGNSEDENNLGIC